MRMLLPVVQALLLAASFLTCGCGPTSLPDAVYRGDNAAVARLLDKGQDPNASSRTGTPLRVAAFYGRMESARLLVARGAHVNDPDPATGRTPLFDATTPQMIRYLVSEGAQVNAVGPDAETPLHLARNGGVAVALLSLGADPSRRDKSGKTPLHSAALYGDDDVVAALLVANADPQAKDADGRTPLHWAAAQGEMTTCELLLLKGSGVDSRDGFGLTPLHLAAESGSPELVRMLLSKGARVQAASNGMTALHFAAMHGHVDACRELLKAGAKADSRDKWGRTPLSLAQEELRLTGIPAFEVTSKLLEK